MCSTVYRIRHVPSPAILHLRRRILVYSARLDSHLRCRNKEYRSLCSSGAKRPHRDTGPSLSQIELTMPARLTAWSRACHFSALVEKKTITHDFLATAFVVQMLTHNTVTIHRQCSLCTFRDKTMTIAASSTTGY